MEDISRRSFIAAAAAASLAIPATALAEEEKELDIANASAEALTGSGNADDYIDNPGTEQTMTLDEINAVRKQIVDRCEDFVQSDGTVIPKVFVQVRELMNTFSVGVGYGVKDGNFDQVMHNFSEEEAAAYVNSPWGAMYTAQDFANLNPEYTEETADELLFGMSQRGLIYRVTRAGRRYYHINGYFHGIWEFGSLYHVFNRTDPSAETFVEKFQDPAVVDLCNMHTSQWGDMSGNATATAFFYTHPVGQEVLVEGEDIITYDDWRAQIARNETIAVSPCQCRMRRYAQDAWIYDGPCDHPIETCMSFGEFADYYIENNMGRQITQDEAYAIIEDAIDHGMIIQTMYDKAMELVCCCHGDCCDIMSGYVALGDGITEGAAAVKQANVSHYLLEYDKDACIKCGACVERCPVYAISIGEDGYPEVSPTCVRCGQCGLVCPAGARKLTAREEIPYLPATMLDDYNLKASDRMSHGLLH